MPLTPNSNSSSYLTPTDFLNFIDSDMLGQLYGSNGVPLTPLQLAADARVQTAVDAASGELEAAAVVGERYMPSDIVALNGVSARHMRKVIADLAVFICYSYRDGPMPPQNVVARDAAARQVLEKLRLGEEVFSFTESEDAGLPGVQQMTPADIYNLNLVSNRMTRAFGERQNVRRYQ